MLELKCQEKSCYCCMCCLGCRIAELWCICCNLMNHQQFLTVLEGDIELGFFILFLILKYVLSYLLCLEIVQKLTKTHSTTCLRNDFNSFMMETGIEEKRSHLSTWFLVNLDCCPQRCCRQLVSWKF